MAERIIIHFTEPAMVAHIGGQSYVVLVTDLQRAIDGDHPYLMNYRGRPLGRIVDHGEVAGVAWVEVERIER